MDLRKTLMIAASLTVLVAAQPAVAQDRMDELFNPLGDMDTMSAAQEANDADMMIALSPEEAAAMEAQIEREKSRAKEKVRKQAFDTAIEGIMPLNPEEIRKLYDEFRESREAAETPIAEPEPKIHVETVSLDPGELPSIVKTSAGHVTTVTILDATGRPWPIQDVSFAGKYEIAVPEEGGHVIRVTPLTAHGVGNISMRLVGLVTPITFSLKTGLDVSHYRFDARIPKRGPLAKVPLIQEGGLTTVAGSAVLTNVLMGTPPRGATKLRVTGLDGQTSAWKDGNMMFLRTPLTLLSPAWKSSVTSGDGMNVYEMKQAPAILLSDNGKMVRATIGSWEMNDE